MHCPSQIITRVLLPVLRVILYLDTVIVHVTTWLANMQGTCDLVLLWRRFQLSSLHPLHAECIQSYSVLVDAQLSSFR